MNTAITMTAGQWFDSLALVLPACQVSCILFLRQEYNDSFDFAKLSYNLLAYTFLVYDYRHAYRKRFDYENTD